MSADKLHRALAVLLEQVANREGARQHDADIARNLNRPVKFFFVGEKRIEHPTAKDFAKDPGEVLNNTGGQHHFDKGIHNLAKEQKSFDHP
ncbi:hypothetical protein D3C78_1847430 [compost metagenome]